MRIAIDARFYRSEAGGIGRYTQNLIKELAKIDQKNQYTVFITPKDEAEYEQHAKGFKKEIVSIPHYSLAEQTKFLKILNAGNFDLVHFLNFNHPIFYQRPFIATIHDLTMLLYPSGSQQKSKLKRWAFKKVMKNAVKNSRAIIAVSRATKKDCIKYLGANPKKIKVIYEAVDPSYARKIRSTKSEARNKSKILNTKYKIQFPYLLFVSQWRPHKGLPELIKAFEILKEKYPTSLKLRGTSKIPHQLVITGRPNKNFPEIPFIIHNSKFKNSIITPGFVNDQDLPIIYQNAEAFIFPSFYEGFGLGPLEAMACGTPVISSNLSCMPEILGDAAQYFNPHNITDVVDKIYQTLTKTNLRKKMIAKGFRQIKKYSWAKMAKETLEVYQEILSA